PHRNIAEGTNHDALLVLALVLYDSASRSLEDSVTQTSLHPVNRKVHVDPFQNNQRHCAFSSNMQSGRGTFGKRRRSHPTRQPRDLPRTNNSPKSVSGPATECALDR